MCSKWIKHAFFRQKFFPEWFYHMILGTHLLSFVNVELNKIEIPQYDIIFVVVMQWRKFINHSQNLLLIHFSPLGSIKYSKIESLVVFDKFDIVESARYMLRCD